MDFPKTLPASRIPPAADTPRLRWGVLGTGWIAAKFVESVKAHTGQEIAAVGSRSRASAGAFAARWGVPRAWESYEALVADPGLDVIYVATPHNLHRDHVLMAIEAGKHVLVEKPMALNQAQAAEMVAAARRRGVFLAEALWTFFLPKFDVLRQVLDAGVIGEIRSVHTEYGEYLPRDHRIFDPALAGGPLLDLGTYPAAFMESLLGPAERVVGLGQPDPSGVNGQLSVVMANARGALGALSTTLYGFTPTNAAIVGERGSIRFDGEFHLPGPFEVRSRDGAAVLRHEEPRGAHFEGLYYQAAEVARRIAAGERETPCRPLAASLATMALLDAIRDCVGIDFAAALQGEGART